MKENWQRTFCGIAAASLGLASIIAPVFILGVRRYEAPLFPAVRSGIEGLSSLSALLLLVSGLFLGSLVPKRPLLVGVCTMSAFPLMALAEMIVAPASHNMWPLEILIYGVLTVPAIVGAFAGRFARSLFWR